jgi:hypothetical protein
MKKLLGLAVLGVALLFSDAAMNQPLKFTENLPHKQILLPASTPDKGRMEERDTLMFFETGGVAGILVFYDDTRTKWDIDYIEFYDLDGNLLMVTWLDRLGVCQVAMDRGLLDAEHPGLDGTLVMIAVGTPA